ncbi:membrane protein [Mycolicibacterium wolinskyi]|uniref:Membrane protein n=1 Tax=Mycolicibacterium wolinskyi TaxID=59750 RepID=A0A132PDU1_9MYCO|nr:membrane protein [Mycolicibacterium wolinskyi]
MWYPRSWQQCSVAGAVAVGVGLAVGIPSALVPNPWFARMTAVPGWGYAAWILIAVMSAVLAATYVGDASATSTTSRRTGIVANIGSILAVGCPVCNKLVVATLGVSGALNMWAPVQPVIAAVSVSLLGWALWQRISSRRACPAPSDVGRVTQSVTAALDRP